MRHPTASIFTQDELRGFYVRYSNLLASIHSLSIELDKKTFPTASKKLWTHRATTLSSAVSNLLEGRDLPLEQRFTKDEKALERAIKKEEEES